MGISGSDVEGSGDGAGDIGMDTVVVADEDG